MNFRRKQIKHGNLKHYSNHWRKFSFNFLFLQSLKVIKAESATYGFLNLFGIGIAGYAHWLIPVMPIVDLETAWCAIALYGLINFIKKETFHVKQD